MGGNSGQEANGLREELAQLRQRVAELEACGARQGEPSEGLRAGGEIFRSIVDATNDTILILDEQGAIVYINRAGERLFGYTAAEVSGRKLHELLIPERFKKYSREAFAAHAATGMGGMLDTVREFSALRKNGVEFPVEASISSSQAEGKPVYITICRDISERRRVEDELRESQQRYRDLVENLNDVIFTLDSLGRISFISPTIERITGYRAEELVGQPFTRFVHPDDLQGLLERYELALSGDIEAHEFRAIDKDGEVLHVKTSSRPLLKNGELAGLTGLLTDISKRKLAEEELERYRADLEKLVDERTRELERATERLHRSERYFRALIENANDIIAVLNQDGTMGYLSPSLERISGFSQEERLGKNAFDFFHPDDLSRVMEAFAKGMERPGFTDVVEYRWQHADGSWRWQEAVASNLLDDPAVRGIVVNARDITDRKLTEEALRESEERYRSVVETSPDGIILVDLEGRILMVNSSGLKLFRCEDESQMVGRSVTEFMLPDEWPRAREPMLQRVDLLQEPIEFTSVRADGSRFISESNSRMIRNAGGEPVGFLSITRDVTERRRAEDRLRKLNECFLSLGPDPLENIRLMALTGVDILEADMARYGRMEKGVFYIFSSLQAEQGFKQLEDPGDYLCYQLLSSGASGPVTSENMDRRVFEGDPDVRQHGFRSCLYHPITVQGEPVGCFNMLARDERSFSQVEIDSMAMLSRAISIEEERYAFEESLRDFVDIASHELRHPVALLTGYTETLEAHGSGMDDSTRGEVIEAIRNSTERISHMIMGLMNISLVERERFTISRRREELVALTERVAREMRIKAPGWDFELKPADGVVECEVDRERYHDLMVILLDNAVKYSPVGTTVEINITRSAGSVTVSVLDRGVGVPPEHRGRLFERFYQVEEAQHHSTPGLGLGLFLARQIVEGHGGRIWYEPRDGGGSVFCFTLPA